MKLALESLCLASVDEVPVTTGAAVVAPAGDDRIVGENGVDGDVGFVFIAEVSGPVVNFFLASGVPWHFTAEGVGFAFPSIGTLPHPVFKLCSLFGPTFVLQILEQAKEDGAFHQAKARVVGRLRAHGECGFVSLIEIPLPWMFGNDAL